MGRILKNDRWNWKSKLRWFCAEYMIVVLGVLTAVWIGALWERSQNHTRETIYLHQLLADLERTEAEMDRIDKGLKPALEAGANFARAFYLQQPPPADSLIEWFTKMSAASSSQPVVGTAEALVSTGDLALIRDDSLRSSITSYLDQTRRYLRYDESTITKWLEHHTVLSRAFDPSTTLSKIPMDARDSLAAAEGFWFVPENGRSPFPVDPKIILSDTALLHTVAQLQQNAGFLARFRSWFRRDAIALQEHIESVLGQL